MSEKGGKGGSLLSKGSLKGKDDSAGKSAKGRKVKFSAEGPQFESGINTPKFGGKGDSSVKGGKGDKVANSAKASASKEPPSEQRVDQNLPENIKCLLDCEAADTLQGIQDRMVTLSRDPSLKIPVSFDKGLQYAKSSCKYTNPESVRRSLEPLAACGLTDSEICVIGNVCPETVDEVFALLPSLKGKKNAISELLKDSLIELGKLRRPM